MYFLEGVGGRHNGNLLGLLSPGFNTGLMHLLPSGGGVLNSAVPKSSGGRKSIRCRRGL